MEKFEQVIINLVTSLKEHLAFLVFLCKILFYKYGKFIELQELFTKYQHISSQSELYTGLSIKTEKAL